MKNGNSCSDKEMESINKPTNPVPDSRIGPAQSLASRPGRDDQSNMTMVSFIN
jgi:hypothetical protein